MPQALVEKRSWLSVQRFLHALNYCMLLLGTETQQLATYIAWLMRRSWGVSLLCCHPPQKKLLLQIFCDFIQANLTGFMNGYSGLK
jgi:hypothetical protein